MHSRHVIRILLLLSGLIVGLGAAEVLLRVTGTAPTVIPIAAGRFRLSRDRAIGYEPNPDIPVEDARLPWVDPLIGYEAPVNAEGYRDTDHAPEKPSGTYRIVVLGDSVAAGLLVRQYTDTFPARLESGLREQGIAAEVLNFGVRGYVTSQEVATLAARGLAYQPDLVLVAYCLNDAYGPIDDIMSRLMEREQAAPGLSARLASPWLVRSALYRFVRFRLGAGHATPQEGRAFYEPLVGSYPAVESAMDRLMDLSVKHGFQVLLAFFPWQDGDRAEDFERVARIAADRGFHYLDLRPAFQACGKGTMLDPIHPSAAGHACAADALLSTIQPLVHR